MTYGLVTICYNEERFIGPFLKHIPDWIDTKLVLRSTTPWSGTIDALDDTAEIAKEYASVVENHWLTEHEQRNTGQDLLGHVDWVIVLDPDEFLSDENWDKLRDFLDTTESDAVIIENQRVFWKDKEVSPCNDYQQLIAVRPHVKFVDKRVVNTSYVVAPVELLHFSWARTDDEVWSKISHYAHSNDFDTEDWYKNVWLADKQTNMHPTSPEALGGLIEAKLPPEIKELQLCPPQ